VISASSRQSLVRAKIARLFAAGLFIRPGLFIRAELVASNPVSL
jgi:hypothetical protein